MSIRSCAATPVGNAATMQPINHPIASLALPLVGSMSLTTFLADAASLPPAWMGFRPEMEVT